MDQNSKTFPWQNLIFHDQFCNGPRIRSKWGNKSFFLQTAFCHGKAHVKPALIYIKISVKNVSYFSSSYKGPPPLLAKSQLLAHGSLDGKLKWCPGSLKKWQKINFAKRTENSLTIPCPRPQINFKFRDFSKFSMTVGSLNCYRGE